MTASTSSFSNVFTKPSVIATLLPAMGELYAKAFGIGIRASISRGVFMPLFWLNLSTIACNSGFSDCVIGRTR